MNIRYLMAGLVIAMAGYTSSASAVEPSAVLQQPKGQVFIGQATTLTPARHGAPLYAGNRIMVTANGGGTVVYADGCAVLLPANSLLTISGPDQCKIGQAVTHTIQGFQDNRIGQAGTVRRSRNPTAFIEQMEGSGRVDRARAVRGMRLFSNNTVTAGANGRIVIRYSNDCEVVVEAGQSLLVGDASTCNTRRIEPDSNSTVQTEDESKGATQEGAAGAAGGVAPWVPAAAIAGGFAVAAGVAASDDDEEAITPAPSISPR